MTSLLGATPTGLFSRHAGASVSRLCAAVVALGVLTLGTAPAAARADPPSDSADDAAPLAAGDPAGSVPSGPPGVFHTSDGRTLTVAGRNESVEPVAPLTGSRTSREYLVGSEFITSVIGGDTTTSAGSGLEAGYQIGCGISQGAFESSTRLGATPSVGIPIIDGSIFPITLGLSATQSLKVDLEPGSVQTIAVSRQSFTGNQPRITLAGIRIEIDGCAGQSFIRSYATFTSSTDDADDVVTYVGVTKAV